MILVVRPSKNLFPTRRVFDMTKGIELRTLVLGPSFMPVSVVPNLYTISAEDAIVRYLNKTCEVIYWYDRHVLTPSRHDLRWPSVIMNTHAPSLKKEIRLKKSALFYRDECECVYCGSPLTMDQMTYDHVMPRDRGGSHSWDNVALACTECNSRKGNQLPKGKWEPKKKPYVPTFFDILNNRKKFPITVDDESWIQFLPGFVNVHVRGKKQEEAA